MTGQYLGQILHAAIQSSMQSSKEYVSPNIASAHKNLELPLEPLESEESALAFARQQEAWVKDAQAKFFRDSEESGENRDINDALRAPLGCCEYALELVSSVQNQREGKKRRKARP